MIAGNWFGRIVCQVENLLTEVFFTMLDRRIYNGIGWFTAFLVCITITTNVHAQKVYKIVDEKTGKVTFSHIPPKKKEENVRVEGLNVDNGGATPILMKGGRPFCGDIKLYVDTHTKAIREPKLYRSRLQAKRDRWADSRRSVARQLEYGDQSQARRSNSEYSRYESDSRRNERYTAYERNKAINAKRLKDLNCAVDWAEKELARFDNMDSMYDDPRRPGVDTQELDRLAGLIKQHEARKIRMCGPEPVFDPTNIQSATKTENWKKCTKNFDNEIRKLERRMYKVEREGYR